MKTIYRHFAAAIALIAAVSCAKQEEMPSQEGNGQTGTYEFILNVAQEDVTKTTMDGLNILWSKDDQIGVACYGVTAKDCGGAQSIVDKDNYTPATAASFKLELAEGITPVIAAYPYHDKIIYTNGTSTDDVDACAVEIPAVQTGVKGNIPANAFAMVGKIDKADGSCQMSNAGAVIKFEITGNNVTSLKFEGNNSENISGRRMYFASSGAGHKPGEIISSKDSELTPESYVMLKPSGEVFEPGDYYFVVSQNTLTDGFTMTLTNSLGAQAVRKSTGEFKIERNHKYTNFGSDEGWFNDVRTGVAGNVGTAAGTTATLYGIAPDTIEGEYVLGFQTSVNNSSWSEFTGEITERFSTNHTANVFTGQIEGLTPETTYYFRATYTNADGITTYGKSKTFKTYANAHSAVIDMCTGIDDDYWPFTNIAHGGDGGLVSGTSGGAISKGKDLTLTTSTAESFVVNAEGGVWINSQKGCLTMGVNKGEYIKFPVIEGKKPVCVTLLAGNMATSDNPTSSTNCLGYPSIGKVSVVNEEETFTSTEVAGGEQWNPVPMSIYDSHTWYLAVTDSGKYGIYFNHDGKRNCYISLLEVVYVDANQTTVTDNLAWWPGHGNHNDSSNPEKDLSIQWPFDPTRGSWDDDNDCIFSSKTNENFKYSFKSTSKIDYTRAGFKIGGTAGDYIAIKPSGGYRLKSVRMRGGSSSNSYSIVDVQDNVITGGEAQNIASAYDSQLTFTLSGTTADTEYRLRINTTTITNIREMWIEYELVK